MSSSLNIPLEDSPDSLNTKINLNGDVEKREGSYYRFSTETFCAGLTSVGYQLLTGENILINKEAQSLVVTMLPTKATVGAATQLFSKSDVWSAALRDLRCDHVLTSEITPRVVFVNDLSVPVQVSVIETTVTVANGSTDVSTTDSRFADVLSSEAILVFNNSKFTFVSKTTSSGTHTFTMGSNATATGTGTLLWISWQWWAEGLLLTDDQVYKGTERFNTAATAASTEVVVDIPSEVRINIITDADGLAYGKLPFKVYQDSVASPTEFTFATDFIPDNATEYNFSTGIAREPSSNDVVAFGYTHITFGNTAPTADPTPIHFVRGHLLGFNGGTGAAADDIDVYVGDTAWTFATDATLTDQSAGTPKYRLYDSAFASQVTTSSTTASFIAFDGSYPFGVPNLDTIRVIHTATSSYIGSGASATYGPDEWKDGYCVPAYGIQERANYSSGIFPGVVSIYQGRIILSSFPSDPTVVVLSNTYDNSVPGEYFSDYQINLGQGLADDAFDIRVDLSKDEVVTAVKSWQESLFVFTQESVVRVWGGESISVTALNNFQSQIATVGCKNQQSVTNIDTTLLFISDNGIYDLVGTQVVGDYTLSNRALKIRNILENTKDKNASVAWMTYDETRSLVWVGLSDNWQDYVSTRLFVYNILYDAWSEYSDASGYFFGVGGVSTKGRTVLYNTVYSDYAQATAPTEVAYALEMDSQDFYYDRVIEETDNTSPFDIDYTNYLIQSHSTSANQRIYSTRLEDVRDYRAFRLFPLADVQDVVVVYDSTTLTFGTDYVKTPNGDIKLLLDDIEAGRTLTIQRVNTDLDSPVSLYVDNLKFTETADYTIADGAPEYNATYVTAQHASSVRRFGLQYPVWRKSPIIVQDDLSRHKRISHFIGFFSNLGYHDKYDQDDVNSISSQDETEIIDKYKVNLNFNVATLLHSRLSGITSTNLYGSNALAWDGSVFDISGSPAQYEENAKLIVPIIGISDILQIVIYSFDDNSFSMAGYQLQLKVSGRKLRSWYH